MRRQGLRCTPFQPTTNDKRCTNAHFSSPPLLLYSVCYRAFILITMETRVFISMTKDELETLIIDCVNACLRNDKTKKEETHEDVLMTIQEAAEFLHLTVPTLYSKCSKGELPVKKRSKRLYFSKLELISYLNDGSR